MEPKEIIKALDKNRGRILALLSELPEGISTWSQSPEKWTALEILCHLVDSEIDDFRMRVQLTLEGGTVLPPIDPQGWVKDRNYAEQNFMQKLQEFDLERRKSIDWLKSLENPDWDACYEHPKYGPMSARLFLKNWLVHDYLHMRQIVKLQYDFLCASAEVYMEYAGTW